jgi:tetratricopeptide (TPR) repeat protein
MADGREEWVRYAREFAEFAIVSRADNDLAERILAGFDRNRATDARVEVLLELQRALHTKEGDRARALIERLRRSMAAEDARVARIQANALAARFETCLEEGRLACAREALWQWEALSPMDWASGRFSLARARLWHKLGWLDGAVAELEGIRRLDPLLPRLPDVEFALAERLAERGDTQPARDLFRSILENYPNHAMAEKARSRL